MLLLFLVLFLTTGIYFLVVFIYIVVHSKCSTNTWEMRYTYYVTSNAKEQTFEISGPDYHLIQSWPLCNYCNVEYSACLDYDTTYAVELYDNASNGWSANSYISFYNGNEFLGTVTLLSGNYAKATIYVEQPENTEIDFMMYFVIGFVAVFVIAMIYNIVTCIKSKNNIPVTKPSVSYVCKIYMC